MAAQTPIKCFVRLGGLFFIEDYAGTRTPICMAADEDQADWLGWTLERAHGCPVKPWNYTDPEAPAEGTKLRPVNAIPEQIGVPSTFPQHIDREGTGHYAPDRVSVSCPDKCKCTAESGCLEVQRTEPLVDLDALNAAWAGRNIRIPAPDGAADAPAGRDPEFAPDGGEGSDGEPAAGDRPQ